VLLILQVSLRSHRAGSEAKSFCTSRVEAICWRNCRPNCHSLDIARLTTADKASSALSIVKVVVIAPRRHRSRTLQELRRVMTRFARSRALGRIAADLGL
jgi:hypothetical protein